ncbi:hypothetical protein ACOSQ4_012126 [Xanthoceras sorbifolium]
MEDRSLHPSIFLKIDGKSHLFVRNFCKSQVSTPGISGALAYVPGVLHGHLHPARQGTASMTVQPVTPVFIGAPSEIRNAAPRIFLSFLSLASITVIAPFERVKLLTQCQNEMIKSGRLSHPYKGIGDCFARTVRNEGFISLWRGNTASMLEQTSSKVIKYALDNYFRSLFNYKRDKDGSVKLWLAGNLARDSLVRALTLFLVHPLLFAQTRLANDIKTAHIVNKWHYDGIVDIYRKTLKSDSIVGLYRGYNIALVEICVGNIVLVGTHFTLKPLLLLGLKPLGFQHNMLATAAVGVGVAFCAKLPTYPLDTLHRRMMMRSGEAVKYKSSLDAFSQILKDEGIKSLYKGVGAHFIQLSIVSGLAMVGAKLLLKIFYPKTNASGKQSNRIVINWKNGKDGGPGSR